MNRRLIATRRRNAKRTLYDRGYYPTGGRKLVTVAELALPGIMVDMMHLTNGAINLYEMAFQANIRYAEEVK